MLYMEVYLEVNSSPIPCGTTSIETDSPARIGRGSISRSQALSIFGMLVASYFCSFFFRISASVVLPRVGVEWGMSATAIGLISALYFYAYAGMQPISGALNDRFGPVRIVACGMILTAISALFMGFADSAWQFGIGRLLSGLGLAPMLSGALVFQAAAFDAAQYTRLSSITYTIGNLGAVVSVAPLELALKTWGRRSVFAWLAVGSLIVVIGLLTQRKRDLVRTNHSSAQVEPTWRRLREAFSILRHSTQLKAMLIVWAVSTAALMVLQGLWAVSWFRSAYEVDLSTASGWATLIGVGVMIGNFVGGHFGNGPYQRRKAIRVACTLYGLCWVLLWCAVTIRLPIYIAGLIGLALGAAAGASYVQCTCGVNDIALQGKGGALFGVLNLFNFVTVILYQSGTGFLLHWFPAAVPGTYTATGYLVVLGSAAGTVILSLVALLFLRPFSAEALKEGAHNGAGSKAP